MYKEDLEVTDRLDDREELKIGYHPILKELHHKNAMRLDAIFKEEGYDILKKMDEKTKEAAFIIIQHAISDPLFMKEMYYVFKRYDLKLYSAYLYDRLAYFQRRPQCYGTQFHYGLDGKMQLYQTQDLGHVDERRKSVGLGPIFEVTKICAGYPPISKEEAYQNYLAERAWLLSTGWCDEKMIKEYERSIGFDH